MEQTQTSEIEKTYFCFCGNGYDNPDTLEIHLEFYEQDLIRKDLLLDQPITTFHNQKLIKKKYLCLYEKAKKEGKLIRGEYFCIQEQRGCFVGMAVHSGDHQRFASESGISEWLIRLGEQFFENLPKETFLDYPERLINSIPVGATKEQLEKVKHQFLEFCLTKICKNIDHPTVQNAMKLVISLHQRCVEKGLQSVKEDEWSAAEYAARSAAAAAAWSAYEYAARSAAAAAARSAAAAAGAAAAWSAAWSAAEYADYVESSEKLLELLENLK